MPDTTNSLGDLISIPALLARNSKQFASKPAFREKEFGIWQSFTWAEVAEEVQAMALGLMHHGIRKGDHVAVIGRNRPALYWAMVAVQKTGGIPVPLYQDAVASRWHMSWSIAARDLSCVATKSKWIKCCRCRKLFLASND